MCKKPWKKQWYERRDVRTTVNRCSRNVVFQTEERALVRTPSTGDVQLK